MSKGNLKLAAIDVEDIAVLSALLQDAVVPMSEMIYLPGDKRFAIVANRFRWEKTVDDNVLGGVYERVRCGLAFDMVTRVLRRRVDRHDERQVLDLLALEATNEYVDLIFAGGAMIRLYVERILCHAEDFGEPWSTQWRPDHDLED